MNRPFSLLVKPVGGACNLDCRYCFYKRSHAAGMMDDATFNRLAESYCALPMPGKAMAFQGGEPLLAGIEFFRRADRLPVAKSVQTNATLIDGEFAALFAKGGWLVGASLDGPEPLNALRGESFGAAVRGIRNLERAGADYNLLTVVSRANVKRPAEVYRFLRDNFATRFLQFIECTGPCEEINGEEWGDFLIGLFDEWIKADAHTVSIRMFDSIVSQLVLGYPTQCSYDSSCHQYLVVEHDGSVYPCDFHVLPELKLGNIMTHEWAELVGSPIFRRFAENKLASLPQKCRECEFFQFCRGDCPRSRQTLCSGLRKFFAHSLPRFQDLLRDRA